MIPLVDNALEEYAALHSSEPSALLDELERYTYAHCEYPEMVVGRLEGALLRMLVGLSGARRILEIGLYTGYSALTIAEQLPGDGSIISCELDVGHAAVARSFFERSPHGSKIDIRVGPAMDTLPALSGPFDLVFLDADKENYPAYFDAVLPMIRPGGLLVADNVLWSGRVLSPSRDSDRALAAFNDRVQSDPRVENVLLTVRDGVMLARKRAD